MKPTLVALLLLSLASGCQTLVDFDRDLVDGGDGGAKASHAHGELADAGVDD